MKKLDRIGFVKYWAKFVRENPDEVWSKQQAVVINSQLKSKQLSRKQYLMIKEKAAEYKKTSR